MCFPVLTAYCWCSFDVNLRYIFLYIKNIFFLIKEKKNYIEIKFDVTPSVQQIREALFWLLVNICCQNQTEWWLCLLLWGCLSSAEEDTASLLTGVSQGFTGDLGFKTTSPSLSWGFAFMRDVSCWRRTTVLELSPSASGTWAEGVLSKMINGCLQGDSFTHWLTGTNLKNCPATAWFISKDYQDNNGLLKDDAL